MSSRFLRGGGAGIAVISVFNEGGEVKCISSRYSCLQRVIIGIKKTSTGLYNENFRKLKGIAEIWIFIQFNMSNNFDDFLL